MLVAGCGGSSGSRSANTRATETSPQASVKPPPAAQGANGGKHRKSAANAKAKTLKHAAAGSAQTKKIRSQAVRGKVAQRIIKQLTSSGSSHEIGRAKKVLRRILRQSRSGGDRSAEGSSQGQGTVAAAVQKLLNNAGAK